MKTQVLKTIFVGLLLVLLTACNDEGSSKASPNQQQEQEDVHATGLELSPKVLNLVNGGAGSQLEVTVLPKNTNQNVTWSTSNPAVAQVTDGFVTPIAVGNATITATAVDGGFTATATVTVTDSDYVPVSGVGLARDLTLENGGVMSEIDYIVHPVNATDPSVTWTSSNEAIATVADGVVTPVAVGTAIVTVRTNDGGFTATCTVYVCNRYNVTVMNNSSVEIGVRKDCGLPVYLPAGTKNVWEVVEHWRVSFSVGGCPAYPDGWYVNFFSLTGHKIIVVSDTEITVGEAATTVVDVVDEATTDPCPPSPQEQYCPPTVP